MKKIMLASTLLAAMGIGAFSVYADAGSVNEFNPKYNHMSNDNVDRNKISSDKEIFIHEEDRGWSNERQTDNSRYREEIIQTALDEGWITEDEAVERRTELIERDLLNEEDRFSRRRYNHHGIQKGYGQGRSYHCH